MAIPDAKISDGRTGIPNRDPAALHSHLSFFLFISTTRMYKDSCLNLKSTWFCRNMCIRNSVSDIENKAHCPLIGNGIIVNITMSGTPSLRHFYGARSKFTFDILHT